MVNDTMLGQIADELSIRKSVDEEEAAYRFRLLYSALGLQILAAANDGEESGHVAAQANMPLGVSVQHVRNRAQELALQFGLDDPERHWPGIILGTYLKAGFLYHAVYRIMPCRLSYARTESIILQRGEDAMLVRRMSGLGSLKDQGATGIERTIEEQFNLEACTNYAWFSAFMGSLSWQDYSDLPTDGQYLNSTYDFRKGYWQTKAPKSSLLLWRSGDFRDYRLFRLIGEKQMSKIPDYLTSGGKYLRIALALLVQNGFIPRSTLRIGNKLAKIELDYLLPPEEQTFFELYSWPDIDEKGLGTRLNRFVDPALVPVLKQLLERLGFDSMVMEA
jgi:hypothetical protein